MIIVIDCNIWVTLSISRQTTFLYILQKKGIQIAACQQLYDEISTVLQRPKFRKYLSKFDIDQLTQIYFALTTDHRLSEIEFVVSDPKDNYLFSLCKVSNADYFVTGDKLLLDVNQYQQTKLISLADFKSIIS